MLVSSSQQVLAELLVQLNTLSVIDKASFACLETVFHVFQECNLAQIWIEKLPHFFPFPPVFFWLITILPGEEPLENQKQFVYKSYIVLINISFQSIFCFQ